MTYWLVNVGMTLSVVAFGIGFYFRKTERQHRLGRSLGVGICVATALSLVVSVHGFHEGDFVLAGFYPVVPDWAILVHRITATLTALLMVAQTITGVLRKRTWHIRLQRVFIPAYLIIYISGLLIFTNHPP